MAAQRGTSLSALIVEGLKRFVRDEERFEQAALRIKKRLRRASISGRRARRSPGVPTCMSGEFVDTDVRNPFA
jgi:hypothetical protein